MKNNPRVVLLALLMTITVTSSFAATSDDPRPKTEMTTGMTDEQRAARVEQIKTRVNEIKTMDRSSLSKADRKALRKELRELNKEARASRGVYLSVGAIIIIILLLILIL
ncbi:MAG: hypothetical protein H7Y42_11305 [Chitinophagaceae bacterium]|nr:hypothetical protein [Chitinophagaceae bacterium]